MHRGEPCHLTFVRRRALRRVVHRRPVPCGASALVGAGAWTHAYERSRRLHSRFDAFASVEARRGTTATWAEGAERRTFRRCASDELASSRRCPSSYRPRAPPVTVTTGVRGLETSSPCTSLPPSPPYAGCCREASTRIQKTRCLDPPRRSDRIRDRSRRAWSTGLLGTPA